MKNKEIKLFLIRNALSKQVPLKVNGFAETREFPAPVEISSMKNPGKLSRYGISYTCNALSKQIPLKVNGFAETGNSKHPELFEDVSRVSGLSPAHLGKQGGELGFSRQN